MRRTYRFCDVVGLASEGAVTSKEAGRIDAIRAQRPNPLDIGLWLERSDALKAVRISDAARSPGTPSVRIIPLSASRS